MARNYQLEASVKEVKFKVKTKAPNTVIKRALDREVLEEFCSKLLEHLEETGCEDPIAKVTMGTRVEDVGAR